MSWRYFFLSYAFVFISPSPFRFLSTPLFFALYLFFSFSFSLSDERNYVRELVKRGSQNDLREFKFVLGSRFLEKSKLRERGCFVGETLWPFLCVSTRMHFDLNRVSLSKYRLRLYLPWKCRFLLRGFHQILNVCVTRQRNSGTYRTEQKYWIYKHREKL